MSIPLELKEKLIKLKEKLPEEKQQVFAESIKKKLLDFSTENVFKYTLVGACVGFIIDNIPVIGGFADDFTEIGALIGAWVGHSKDKKERAHREEISRIVQESLREALSEK